LYRPGLPAGFGISVRAVKLRLDPAFPVPFLRAKHVPHHGGLAGFVQHVRLAARFVV